MIVQWDMVMGTCWMVVVGHADSAVLYAAPDLYTADCFRTLKADTVMAVFLRSRSPYM